jgi:phage FluMu protein Com
MSVRVHCPSCNKELKAVDEKRGKRIRCPRCQEIFRVPADDEQYSDDEAVIASLANDLREEPLRRDDEEDSYDRPQRRRHRTDEEDRKTPAKTYTRTAVILSGAIAGGFALLLGLAVGLLIGGARQERQAAVMGQNQLAPVAQMPASDAAVIPDGKPPVTPTPKPNPVPRAWTKVPFAKIWEAYQGNQAAADASYLNKPLEFDFRPVGVDKESGGYCVWGNLLGFTDPVLYGKHYKCHFSADKAQAVAGLKMLQTIPIRGVCIGKTGKIRTSNGYRGKYGGFSSAPVIEFKDCELVK